MGAEDYSAIQWADEDIGQGFSESGRAARHIKTLIDNYKLLDFSPLLNTASYVNVVAEPEELEVAVHGLSTNIADQTTAYGSARPFLSAVDVGWCQPTRTLHIDLESTPLVQSASGRPPHSSSAGASYAEMHAGAKGAPFSSH